MLRYNNKIFWSFQILRKEKKKKEIMEIEIIFIKL